VTKAATIETHRFLCLVVLVAMLIAMIPISMAVFPSGLLAADNSTVTCNFTTNNGGPVVNSVALSGSGTMNPGTAYDITVNITDNGTVDDIDSDGTYADPGEPVANNNTCAVLKWTKGGGFALDAGHSGSTWALSGTAPTMTLSTASWIFHVTISHVAEQSNTDASEWHIHADANDGTNATVDNYNANDANEVTWYGEISAVTSTVEWASAMNLGSDNVQSPQFTATFVSNGAFNQQVMGSGTWTGPATLTLDVTGAPGDAQLSLIADDDGTAAGGVQVSTSYQTMNTGTMTLETGDVEGNLYLWLSLGDTGIPAGEYTGSVYLKISN
jgi:hypothetical protein